MHFTLESATGAPEGNRNAAVHFLYARRIMPCGPHCPSWQSCPLGGGAADKGKEMMSRAPADRPTCPFEQAEYNAVVTDALRRSQNHHANAWGLHLAHQVALQTILASRAARALATRGFTDNVESYHGEHLVLSERPAAAMIAYEKLSRELRRWILLLERCYEWISCDNDTAQHHRHRQSTDIAPDPDSLLFTATANPNDQRRGTVPRSMGGSPMALDNQHRGTEHTENFQTRRNPNHEEHKAHEGISQNGSSAPSASSVVIGLEPSNPPNPWPNDLSSAVLRDPEIKDLFAPLKVSDPPGSSLHHVLFPP